MLDFILKKKVRCDITNGRTEVDNKKTTAIENRISKYPDYLKGYYYSKNLSIRSMTTYINTICKFLDALTKNITEVTVDDINKYIYEMKGCSDSHKATTYSAFKSFFDYMYKTNKIKSNPMELVERTKIKKTFEERNDFLTEKELQKFLYNVKNGVGTKRQKSYHKRLRSRDCAICYIYLHTGMRLSALIELNLDDLDFENKSIKVISKGEKEAVYNGLDVCFKYINEWIEDRKNFNVKNENALFVSEKGNRMSQDAVESLVKKYSTGIDKNITPHKLRATYATMLYNKGIDLDTLCTLMKHSSVETTRIYIRGRKDHTADAAKIMSQLCD